MSSPIRSSPKTERTGNVKIITFTAGQKRDVENLIATELEGLTDQLGERHLLLDFTKPSSRVRQLNLVDMSDGLT